MNKSEYEGSPKPEKRSNYMIKQENVSSSFEWREFACGCGAAFINIGVTYPIYKLIFRQMLHGVVLSSAFDQLRYEGFFYLYRGIFPPLIQKTISLSIMFGVYDGTRRRLIENFGVNPYSAKVMGGLISGSFEAILMPLERVQTLLADAKYHTRFRNTIESFKFVYSKYGFKELYRGMVPILWRNGPSNAFFFVLREGVSDGLPKQENKTLRTFQEFTAGAVIGAALSCMFYPFNVIKVSMQSEMGHKYENMFVAGRRIYHERGCSVANFYRGCWFNSSRAFLSWGIMNTAYEHIKESLY